MTELFNVCCNESCHLEHDRQKVMVLGATRCSLEKASASAVGIIKRRTSISTRRLAPWVYP